MSEREVALSSEREREREAMEIIFMFLGFTATIGAHSIFEEVMGFSTLWFPQGKFFMSRLLCFIVVHVILSVKDPKIIMLA